jgi:alpha-L-arabinofuranosidase
MNRGIRTSLLATMLVAAGTSLQARTSECLNVPDSVTLLAYAQDNGESGLRLAWSRDSARWFSVAEGYEYLKSDFGPWGRGKKMFAPRLMQEQGSGKWHCIWRATASGQVMAHASSDDLLTWGAQSYFEPGGEKTYLPAHTCCTRQLEATVEGKAYRGWAQRVPYSLIENLVRYADHKRLRQSLHDEQTAQDGTRFAGLKPLTATLTVDTTQAKAISNHLIGIFFEDINYAADGGLYAELVQNRDFEYSPHDGSREKWDSGYAWTVREGEHTAAPAIGTEQPLHPNNPHYAILQVNTPGTCLENSGYDGIALKQGALYDFSCRARTAPGSRGGKATVSLRTPEGRLLTSARISITADEWKQLRATLTPSEDATGAVLCITPDEPGSYHFDLVSLFPRDTFKGRKNGLRADLAQVLADLHPRFVRFPGGCVAHGDGIDNIYDWKGSIGPLEARKPLRNLWGYHQTRGLGYHEYFLFCEDIGAEPLPVVAAGVPCQNSGTYSHHADSELGCNGQQGGIPQEEMPAYIQDVLDLIEYANGDARKTVWGRKRAEAGHPKPFGLKYIGIGNEDLITSVFEERFTQIYRAVRERYPEITVIGTVGPFYEGTDYNEGWKLATRLGVPMVDEHYYVQPGWFIHNQDFYDRYDRSKPQVYLGEYAAHLPGRPSNLEVALAEALYLTAVERNADVVRMASYAPLLAKEGHTQWRPDLIYFDNTSIRLTPSYYTQQLFGRHAGDLYLPSSLSTDSKRADANKRIGTSVVRRQDTGELIVKLVNLLPVAVSTTVESLPLQGTPAKVDATVLTGKPDDTDAKPQPTTASMDNGRLQCELPPYSFTVVSIKP